VARAGFALRLVKRARVCLGCSFFMRWRWLVLATTLFVTSSAAFVRAQPATEPRRVVASSAAEAEQGKPAEPAMAAPKRRLWDVMKVLPIVFYSPETSLGLGAGTLFQFRLPGAVAEGRPSSITLGGVYTLEHQTLVQFTPDLRFGDDQYVLKLDVLGAKYPNRFYGIGNEPNTDLYDTYTDCYARADLDFRLRPFARDSLFRPIFVGAHVNTAWSNVNDVEAGEDGAGMFQQVNDRGEHELFAAGIGPSLAWDSRNRLNWPTEGSFVEAKATLFEPGLGSQVRYQRLHFEARRYQPLWFSHVLAMRFVTQAAWGDVPFQRLPQLGGASMFRGWYSGQLRGRRLLAVELEYRWPIRERWAVVAFGSAGRVSEDLRSLSFKGLHVSGGAGLRFSVDRHERVNIRLDLAYGNSFTPYLQFREAF
jgi:hypothetical protein